MSTFKNIATGRSIYSTYFLLIFMVVAPTAFFTDWGWLDHIAFGMLDTLGFFILITGFVTLSEGYKSKYWPKVAAYNVRYSLTFTMNNSSKRYMPSVKCNYNVNGKKYAGTEYDFSSSYESKDASKKKVEELKQKGDLFVHYKPNEPNISVVYPGIHFVHFLRLILGVITIVFTTLIWTEQLVL